MFEESVKASELKNRIGEWLNDISLVESLIKTIIEKTQGKSIELEKIMVLRLELEKIRLELEYKNE